MKKILLAFLVVLLGCGGGGGGGGSDDGGDGGSGNTPPVAAFTGSPLSGTVPLSVQFASQSTGDINSHQWDADNDGTVDGGTYTYNHTYTAAGTYTVSLTVVGPAGSDSTTKTDYITVTVLPPNADFEAISNKNKELQSFTDETSKINKELIEDNKTLRDWANYKDIENKELVIQLEELKSVETKLRF